MNLMQLIITRPNTVLTLIPLLLLPKTDVKLWPQENGPYLLSNVHVVILILIGKQFACLVEQLFMYNTVVEIVLANALTTLHPYYPY